MPSVPAPFTVEQLIAVKRAFVSFEDDTVAPLMVMTLRSPLNCLLVKEILYPAQSAMNPELRLVPVPTLTVHAAVSKTSSEAALDVIL